MLERLGRLKERYRQVAGQYDIAVERGSGKGRATSTVHHYVATSGAGACLPVRAGLLRGVAHAPGLGPAAVRRGRSGRGTGGAELAGPAGAQVAAGACQGGPRADARRARRA